MQQPILKQLDTSKQLKNIDFLKETCLQINKDLNGFTNDEVQLTEALLEEPLEDLINQLKPVIKALEDQKNLVPFIYRVDLPEKKMKNYLAGGVSVNKLAHQIIERCAQKVFLRWYFSNRLKH